MDLSTKAHLHDKPERFEDANVTPVRPSLTADLFCFHCLVFASLFVFIPVAAIPQI